MACFSACIFVNTALSEQLNLPNTNTDHRKEGHERVRTGEEARRALRGEKGEGVRGREEGVTGGWWEGRFLEHRTSPCQSQKVQTFIISTLLPEVQQAGTDAEEQASLIIWPAWDRWQVFTVTMPLFSAHAANFACHGAHTFRFPRWGGGDNTRSPAVWKDKHNYTFK